MGDFQVGNLHRNRTLHEIHVDNQQEMAGQINAQAQRQLHEQQNLNQNMQRQQQGRRSVDARHPQIDERAQDALRLSVRQNMPPIYHPDAVGEGQRQPVAEQPQDAQEQPVHQDNQQAQADVNAPEQAARDKTEHSIRIYNMTDYAKRQIGNADAYKLVHIPDEATLGKEYKKRFKDRLNAEERAKKQKNQKSRLYQKAQNAALLTETVGQFETASYDAINAAITRQALRVDTEDYRDLSMFMTEQDEKKGA